ncbi:TetR family transcriptional regulator [Thermosporothrix hazakensis]|jgi:TetR/AcrR family transcriptional repressor of nem operon|uniref:TetR family transcriptional regulator n=2 Tax=Thermosporothrix TaxID=768650 RepID=A0A326UDC6_THEHA|nr:TetR/AcrR family transcriptional regulator [Thermosporothrix hazakensis]PZW34515.1 TetR family transcriptional regulator [Thermosporothrix hazakensis]BBH85638.1 TetR family transcriptional regulator [Thermosporothrix sp. COM3]GCE45933.1 TetR family transcriptional regulator [Thermosporothrix hazakensis]
MARQKEFNPVQVVEKAMYLFWEKGYEGASVEDLVQCTGLGRGSLYATFGDKRSLYLAALDHYEQQNRERRKIFREKTGPLLEMLKAFFQESIAEALEADTHRGCLMVNTALEVAPHDPEIAGKVKSAFREVEELFYYMLIQAQASGELSWEADPHQLARFLLNTHLGIRTLARANPDRKMLQEIATTALSLFH